MHGPQLSCNIKWYHKLLKIRRCLTSCRCGKEYLNYILGLKGSRCREANTGQTWGTRNGVYFPLLRSFSVGGFLHENCHTATGIRQSWVCLTVRWVGRAGCHGRLSELSPEACVQDKSDANQHRHEIRANVWTEVLFRFQRALKPSKCPVWGTLSVCGCLFTYYTWVLCAFQFTRWFKLLSGH